MAEEKNLLKLAGWLVALLVPAALLLTSLRLLMTPAFVNIEYRLPGFPEDRYGMTQQERLTYAPIALDYLLNDEGVDFLGDFRFDDGTPMYNERELSHMLDVKVLTQAALKVWLAVVGALAAIGVWAWRADWLPHYRYSLGAGGKLTLGLIAALLLFVAVSFNQLFVAFHRVFFEGDTWIFLYSDTLIRLFPLRFWQDAFIALGLLTLLGAVALWRFTPPTQS